MAMRRNLIETAMGAIVLAAAAMFLLIVYKSSNTPSVSGYQMTAEFNKIGGLKVGNDVRVSGVPVGNVVSVTLDGDTFKAQVVFDVAAEWLFPTDSVAVIASEGLLGGNFLEIIPGGNSDELKSGDMMEFSQDAVDISQLLGKFMFSSAGNDQK